VKIIVSVGVFFDIELPIVPMILHVDYCMTNCVGRQFAYCRLIDVFTFAVVYDVCMNVLLLETNLLFGLFCSASFCPNLELQVCSY